MPTFTSFPYSAPDHEDRWGFGVGSRIKRRKLFWFAAYDGSLRNDPGVASVKHPENFFAQPTNDEMQVLSARLGLSSVNPVAEGLGSVFGNPGEPERPSGPRGTHRQAVGWVRAPRLAGRRTSPLYPGRDWSPLELPGRRPHPHLGAGREPQLWNQPGKRVLGPG